MESNIMDAYSAGVFDGEGSVGIYVTSNDKGTKQKKFYAIRLAIVGTHRPMMETIYNHFGIGTLTTQKRQTLQVTPKGNYKLEDATDNIRICKQGWKWSLTSKPDVLVVLNKIAPYLNEKKEQAEICLKFLANELDGETASELCKEAKRFNFPATDFIQAARRSGGRSGETNPFSKFSNEDVVTIRSDYANGASVRELVDKWKVSKTTMHRLINNKSYVQDK